MLWMILGIGRSRLFWSDSKATYGTLKNSQLVAISPASPCEFPFGRVEGCSSFTSRTFCHVVPCYTDGAGPGAIRGHVWIFWMDLSPCIASQSQPQRFYRLTAQCRPLPVFQMPTWMLRWHFWGLSPLPKQRSSRVAMGWVINHKKWFSSERHQFQIILGGGSSFSMKSVQWVG